MLLGSVVQIVYKYKVVRENYDLPDGRFFNQAVGNLSSPTMVQRRNWVVENQCGSMVCRSELGQKAASATQVCSPSLRIFATLASGFANNLF